MSDSLMIVTDLDGTIVGSSFSIGEVDRNSLDRLSKQGVILVAATGRSLYKTLEVLGENSPFDYVVFSTGAGIYNNKNKTIVQDSFIEASIGQKVRALLIEQKENFVDYHQIPNNHYFNYYRSYACQEYEDYISRYKELNLAFEGDNESTRNSAQFMIVIKREEERFEKLKACMESSLGEEISVIRATSPFDPNYIWVEVFPKNVSKGSGLEALFEETGHSINNVMGIGNDYNDIDFLSLLPNSFVVENAPEELKNQFSVMPSVDDAGFTSAVEYFLKKKRGYGLQCE